MGLSSPLNPRNVFSRGPFLPISCFGVCSFQDLRNAQTLDDGWPESAEEPVTLVPLKNVRSTKKTCCKLKMY